MNLPLVIAYLLAMFAWIPLLLIKASGGNQIDTRRLRNASLLSIALLVYEAYMRFIWSPTVVAPMRLDLLMLVPIAACVSAYYAIQIWRDSTPKESYQATISGARWVSVILLFIPFLTMLGFFVVGNRSVQMNQQLSDQSRFEYEMRFRNAETVQRFFGTTKETSQWSGYFKSDQAEAAWSEVLINDVGHFWLFRKDHSSHEGQFQAKDASDVLIRVGNLHIGPIGGNKIEMRMREEGELQVSEFLANGNLLASTILRRSTPPSFPEKENIKRVTVS